MRRAGGYVLLELAFMLLMFAVLLPAAFVAARAGLQGSGLETAAALLAADLRELQQLAVSEEAASCFARFYTANEKYLIMKSGNPAPRVVKEVVLPPGVDLYSVNFPGQGNEVAFCPSGAPTPGGGTVTLRDRATGRFKYVIVAAVTGRVRVSDLPPDAAETGQR